jgi:hypothetical protein
MTTGAQFLHAIMKSAVSQALASQMVPNSHFSISQYPNNSFLARYAKLITSVARMQLLIV